MAAMASTAAAATKVGKPSACYLGDKLAAHFVSAFLPNFETFTEWKTLSDDAFLEQYSDFFVACAGVTSSLNLALLQNTRRRAMHCGASTSASAASRVSFVFKTAMKSVANMTDGARMPPVYTRLLTAMRDRPLEKRKASFGSSSSAPASEQDVSSAPQAVTSVAHPSSVDKAAKAKMVAPSTAAAILKIYGCDASTTVCVDSSGDELVDAAPTTTKSGAGSSIGAASSGSNGVASKGATMVEWCEGGILYRRTSMD